MKIYKHEKDLSKHKKGLSKHEKGLSDLEHSKMYRYFITKGSKACKACQEVRNSPASAPLHPWIWLTKPWLRVQIDFAGPFLNRMFLVAVDAYSKWPKVVEMSTGPAGVSTARTIEELRRIFSIHGLPQQIVSDNGPQFISDQFAQFLKQNGIKHLKSSPYHPSSNGLTERFIHTLKKALKTSKDGGILQKSLASFLLSYRTSPHATVKEKPCVLLMGRSLRTRLANLTMNKLTYYHLKTRCCVQVKPLLIYCYSMYYNSS